MNEDLGQRYDSIRFTEIKGIIESAEYLSQEKVDQLSNELRSMTLGLDERSQIASMIQKANTKIGAEQFDFGSSDDLLDDHTYRNESSRRPGVLVAIAILFFIQALGGLVSLISAGAMLSYGFSILAVVSLLFSVGTSALQVVAGIGMLNMTRNAWKFGVALLIANAGNIIVTAVSFAMYSSIFGDSLELFGGMMSIAFILPLLVSIISIVFLVRCFSNDVKEVLNPTDSDKNFAWILGIILVVIPIIVTVIRFNEM